MGDVVVRLLGPVEVEVGGAPVALPGLLGRRIVSALALSPHGRAGTDALIDAVWDDRVPGDPAHSLQQHVSTLRAALEPHRPARERTHLLVRDGDGYRLRVDEVDVELFERAVSRAGVLARSGDDPAALVELGAALSLWRGPALIDARGTARLDASAVRVEEQRLDAVEQRTGLELASGSIGSLVPELRDLTAAHPLRERLWENLIVALYRSGRHAEALAAYQEARRHLAHELGLEPSPSLQQLERAVLDHDPSLRGDGDPTTLGAGVGPAGPSRPLFSTLANDADVAAIVLPDGQMVALGPGSTVLGRDEDADLRLVDSRVSREHARVRLVDGHYLIEDLGSTNGTEVNGEPVTSRVLVPGDVIGLGGPTVRFTAPR